MFSSRVKRKQAAPLGRDAGASPFRRHDRPPRANAPGADDQGEPDVGLRDLIQFFKMTPPPPTNFMSIPDDFSSSEDDRWQRFKRRVFRSVRKQQRRPPVIMLPDSAVAARTTAGHRYIAISIPTEYSHLAPLPRSQYPVYDSMEAAFHREINSRFGMWKGGPPGTGPLLNPVAEEHREQRRSGSRRRQPMTAAPGSSGKALHRSSSLREQQRYTPRRSKGLSKTKSVGSAPQNSRYSDAPAPAMPARNDKRPAPIFPVLVGTSGQQAETLTSKDKDPENPTITLTVPSRKSSRRAQLNGGRGEDDDDGGQKSYSLPSSNDTNGHWDGSESSNGDSSGDRGARISFAASILTTGSSVAPQLLKAQTAKAYRPIIVRPPGGGDGKLDAPGSRKTEQTSLEEKGKEPATNTPFVNLPEMPSSVYSSTPSPVKSESSSQGPVPARAPFSRYRPKGVQADEARDVSKVLAEGQETLEKLPREEVIKKYEQLREKIIYDKERRLRKLERSRDTWVRAVPMLLQDLNGLLREQHKILQSTALTREHSRRHHHRRAHSIDLPSGSTSSYRSLDPPGTQRSRSLHSSSGSRPSYPPSRLYAEE
ncbi:hypothetical protein GGR50DRAFT_693233 [Xylaria sp. CBS 124048]|nr:hypothetical protein GGR50DRAFT_693233 [Xylaria sp. CBS 124048]